MRKVLAVLIISVLITIAIGSEEVNETTEDFSSDETTEQPEEVEESSTEPEEADEPSTEPEDEKLLVKRQIFRPRGLFGLISSFLRPPNYNYEQQNYNRRPQVNNYQQNWRPQQNQYFRPQQNQYYRPQQTLTLSIGPQFGGQGFQIRLPQFNNYQSNPYWNLNFIEHLNKLPRNSETFGYYLDPYHGRRLPENERHLWGPSEAYRESLRIRGEKRIFYYRGYKNFVSKIAFNPHRGVKMYVENVGNIPRF
ncbi:uncharacterized protein [Chironomus tepperi]|uniref:uncharacterized protein n=1 Tax=Chironomus tepperi TaxID=113505 RepID=UPI00391FB9D6